jgi:hypothetical protein
MSANTSQCISRGKSGFIHKCWPRRTVSRWYIISRQVIDRQNVRGNLVGAWATPGRNIFSGSKWLVKVTRDVHSTVSPGYGNSAGCAYNTAAASSSVAFSRALLSRGLSFARVRACTPRKSLELFVTCHTHEANTLKVGNRQTAELSDQPAKATSCSLECHAE